MTQGIDQENIKFLSLTNFHLEILAYGYRVVARYDGRTLYSLEVIYKSQFDKKS